VDRQDVQLTGVEVTPLAVVPGALGSVMHVVRVGAPGFEGFGEAYFSTVDQGAIKGWKLHLEMVCNLVVPVGEVRFVIFDDRPQSATRGGFQEVVLSPGDYRRLTIPPSLWFAFEGRAAGTNLILNVASVPHSSSEQRNLPLENEQIPAYAF
jgi:dTDP-4-dehydrorhamnose 3,5-epimerase